MRVPPETVVFGEIGLSGEVRPVSHTDGRLKEAEKLGFTRAIMPKSRGRKGKKVPAGMEIREIGHLADLLTLFHAPSGISKRPEENAFMKETANG